MKKLVLGYIFYERNLGKDEDAFIKLAKKKNIKLVMFNVSKNIDESEIEKKAKKCDIILNNSAEEFAIEIVKTIEELGKKVIDSSRVYYFIEDKWMFFLMCKKHNIPCPETILLSENIPTAKKELENFKRWPVILKRIEGTQGNYVEKAENVNQAEKIIEKFWKKGNERIPIIAQEFIKSPSYRVTLLNKEVIQTAIKENKGWKCTGVYGKKFRKFEIDKKLKKILNKLFNAIDIKVCGIDLLKKNNKWMVLEANSTPAFDFFEDEREILIGKVLDFLKTQVKKISK